MKCKAWLFTIFAALLGVTGCQTAVEAPLSERKVRVVTTTGMITDLVENIGGDRVEVTGLMGPGVDPHLYNATAGDMSRMAKADVIFYNGLHLEGKMSDVFEQMGHRVKTVAVTERLSEAELRPAPPGLETTHDPHVWFDVALWMKTVPVVRDTLAALDPTHAATYQANAQAYLEQLSKLHEEVKLKAGQIPEAQRVLITAHDAFYYFGHAYGFEVRGLQGISTAEEPSVDAVQKLATFIAERRIPALFVESSVPPRTIQAVQRAVQAKGHTVAIGGELFSDAMGSAGTPEGTYIGMVRHNIDTMVTALAGK